MRVLHKHISGMVAIALVPVVLWSMLPSTVCVCANGKLMLFCGMHGMHGLQAEQGNIERNPCCKARAANQQVGCLDGSVRAGGQWTNKNCTRVTNSRSVATVPASSKVRPDGDLDLSIHALDWTCHKPVAVVRSESQPSTGPPIDLVISLHCLLI